MRSVRPFSIAALAAIGALGCIQIDTSPTFDAPDAAAPLGIVPVDYLSTSDGDISSVPIPAAGLAIAEGAMFRLSPRRSSSKSSVVLVAVDPAALTLAADGEAHALRAGSVGVVAQGADGALHDFVDLSVHAVATVVIEPAGPLPVRVGDTALLAARAFDPAGVRLAGSLEVAWTSSDASIVELVVTGPEAGSRVRALARAEGHATIRVVGPAVATTLEIEVQP